MDEHQEVVETPKPKGKPGRKPKSEMASPNGIDMALVAELIAQMQAGNTEQMRTLAAELRKPTDLEQKKIDDEVNQRVRRQAMAIKIAQQEEAMRFRRQNSCSHMNKDGTLFRAQVNSDGTFTPMCIRCSTTTPPIKAAAGRQVVEMHMWQGVTVETLKNMAKLSQEQPI